MRDANKKLLRGFYERVNSGDLCAVDDLVSDDFVDHEMIPGLPPGKAGVNARFETLRAAFSNARFEVDDVIGDGDKLCVRSRLTGWHRARFMGIPATGSTIDVGLVDTFRVANGQLVEHWGLMDMWSLMQQLTGAASV